MFEIEKNVPLPAKEKVSKYPYAQMEIGDSFVINGTTASGSAQAAYIAAKTYFGAAGHITMKTLDDGKVRIWRIK